MSWKEEFYNAVKNYLNNNSDINATEVTDIRDEPYALTYGGLDYTVDITYNTVERNGRLFTYSGRFADLIEDIT